MIIDTLRADAVKGFCDQRESVNFLERKLRSGTRLSNFISSAGTTRISVNSIFSGCYGGTTGLNYQNCHQEFEQARHFSMTEMFKCQGYQTIGMTQGHISVIPNGFDHLYTEQQTFSVENLKTHLSHSSHNFVYLHFYGVHDPAFGFPEQMTRENYEGLVDSVSDEIELIWSQVINENDVVVVLSDHGCQLRESFDPNWRFYLDEEPTAGCFLSDQTLKSVCSFIAPGLFPQKKLSTLTRGIDVLPTLLDALNLQVVPVQGCSLWPSIKLDLKCNIPYAFAETGGVQKADGLAPSMCIRSNGEKYVRYTTHGEKLYNLAKDPREQDNLLKPSGDGGKLKELLKQQVNDNKQFLAQAVKHYPEDWLLQKNRWPKPNIYKGQRKFAFSGLFDEQTKKHLRQQIGFVEKQWMDNKFNIAIYGASEHSKTFIEQIPSSLSKQFVAVIDGNRQRQGEMFLGLPIVHVSEFEQSYAPDIVLIGHHVLANDMYVSLKNVCSSQPRVFNIYNLQEELPLWWDNVLI
ncbi:sulfatase-like hydrolase/transferase [Agarivorans sp. QJM3NY_33]|uniref:sulfatase-like hydrolase/transferase n=1 Tax=Agarivorans sp. QJM3NY_33 TaxID=3421432 RepID=UPI003F6D54E7